MLISSWLSERKIFSLKSLFTLFSVNAIIFILRLMMLNKSSSLLHFFAKPFTRRFLAGAVVKAKTGMAVPRFLWLREKLGIKSETEKGNIIWVIRASFLCSITI
jgi:hypothetical protein